MAAQTARTVTIALHNCNRPSCAYVHCSCAKLQRASFARFARDDPSLAGHKASNPDINQMNTLQSPQSGLNPATDAGEIFFPYSSACVARFAPSKERVTPDADDRVHPHGLANHG